MPTPTYTPLANITLGSTVTSVTFSSISQAYRDLVLVCDLKGTVLIDIRLRLNSDTGANYSYVYAYGDGSSNASGSYSGDTQMSLDFISYATSTNAHISKAEIMDYSATDKHKTVLVRGNSGAGVDMSAQRWANTAAVTTAQVRPSSGSFAVGSTFALYGIAA